MIRTSLTAPEAQMLDAALRELFRALQRQPTPEIFRIMLDQLTEPPPERAAA